MRIDIATLFPEMCETVLGTSIVGRARKAGTVSLGVHDIRDYAFDKHHRTDDAPYGGGKGMVMLCEPVFLCYEAVRAEIKRKPHVIYVTPQGKPFDQETAIRLSKLENIFFLCGHYEGVDERVLEEIVDEELSLGDFVLTGGELPALAMTDAIVRLCDGVLSDASCYEDESHYSGLLEYPQYTRPETWRGREVPGILLSGHHKNIANWRKEQSLDRTRQKRPDLYEAYMRENKGK